MAGMAERVALVTGVSRRAGIGAAIARRLADAGYRLLLTGLPGYDESHRHGPDPGWEPDLGRYLTIDLTAPGAPEQVVDEAVEHFGALDVIVANHAYSQLTPLGSLTAAELDRHLQVNVRATLLLVQAFAAAYRPERGDGRVVLFSSGQRLGPMPDELAYAASKAAIEALTLSLSDTLAGRGITVNCVNPGPTDTGWATPDLHTELTPRFPRGRWGHPDDAARLVTWLCSPDAEWITGQTIDSEGGFRR